MGCCYWLIVTSGFAILVLKKVLELVILGAGAWLSSKVITNQLIDKSSVIHSFTIFLSMFKNLT